MTCRAVDEYAFAIFFTALRFTPRRRFVLRDDRFSIKAFLLFFVINSIRHFLARHLLCRSAPDNIIRLTPVKAHRNLKKNFISATELIDPTPDAVDFLSMRCPPGVTILDECRGNGCRLGFCIIAHDFIPPEIP